MYLFYLQHENDVLYVSIFVLRYRSSWTDKSILIPFFFLFERHKILQFNVKVFWKVKNS